MPDNFNNKKIKRIGIDARFYGPIGKGLGRYTKEIVDNVIAMDDENEYVIFLSRENFADFNAESRLTGQAGKKIKKVLADVRWYTFSEQILMPYFIKKERLDVMHFTHFNVPLFCPVKFIVTIHDLILTRYPSQRASTLSPILYRIKDMAYRVIIKNAVEKSEKIIAISQFTKQDIISYFDINENKIEVTYEGVSKDLINIESATDTGITLNKYKLGKPYLLYVGNAYPHKNLEGLIDVIAKLNIANLYLVLVGKDDYFYERVKKYAENSGSIKYNIIFPGFVPDAELSILYQKAVAYIFPSLYEGFGLPPLEAMVHGCPVISSDRTSMPEILGDAAYYFDPEDKDDMEKKILEIISDENLRRDLKIRGYEQAKKYSWQGCARKTLEIYNRF